MRNTADFTGSIQLQPENLEIQVRLNIVFQDLCQWSVWGGSQPQRFHSELVPRARIPTDDAAARHSQLREQPLSVFVFQSIRLQQLQETDGIKYPMLMTLKSPMIPMPLAAKVEKIEFNVAVSEDDFK